MVMMMIFQVLGGTRYTVHSPCGLCWCKLFSLTVTMASEDQVHDHQVSTHFWPRFNLISTHFPELADPIFLGCIHLPTHSQTISFLKKPNMFLDLFPKHAKPNLLIFQQSNSRGIPLFISPSKHHQIHIFALQIPMKYPLRNDTFSHVGDVPVVRGGFHAIPHRATSPIPSGKLT